MRIVRVARPGGPAFGVLQDEHVTLLEGHPFGEWRLTDRVAPLERVTLLAPLIPTKVLCTVGAGREPLVTGKLSTAVIGPGDAIRLPPQSEDVHHGAALAVVIGRLTRDVRPADAAGAVLGYTCANDVTAHDLQRTDGLWTRAKGFDTFCPLGPWIETDVRPQDGLTVTCTVDGEMRTRGSTADLTVGVAELVAYCAGFATLLPGDVLLAGNPAWTGPLAAGERVEVEIEGIGRLANPVAGPTGPSGAR